MAGKKGSGADWFYHAPSKHVVKEQVMVPPPSQIPGLSHGPDTDPEDKPRMWIKDTDSHYIKMAKQGGRPDLLRFRSPKPPAEEPQGYPRCEWYYHDEVLAAENNPKQSDGEYNFMLPVYMVHEDRTEQGGATHQSGSSDRRKRAPFAHDETNVYSRDDMNPTDKTVKLPELTPSGYGTRAEKMDNRKPKSYNPIARREPIRQENELDKGKIRFNPVPKEEHQDVVMGKLLSHGYKQDWECRRDTWEAKQKKVQDKFDAQSHPSQDKAQTEYQAKMASSPTKTMATAGMATRRGEQGKSEKSEATGYKTPEKELFKLSKFKNVPSKTDSRRNHQMHGHSPIVHDLEPIDPTIARPVPAAV